jgi:glucan 1,3-beta-glucosidase
MLILQKHILLGHDRGDNQFKKHRDIFITEQDFRDIAAAKLNTVRIPVGYWITGFDNQPGGDPDGWKVYAAGAINYLDRAIREWAIKYNLLVLISMHAAKGSQSGNDHSSPQNPGHAYWSQYPENVRNTLDVVEWLVRRYNSDTAFLGIGLLNEPNSKYR